LIPIRQCEAKSVMLITTMGGAYLQRSQRINYSEHWVSIVFFWNHKFTPFGNLVIEQLPPRIQAYSKSFA